MDNFNVYVIHSAEPLTELKQLLKECGGYSHARIIYKNVTLSDGSRGARKEETKKTIVFCPERTVMELKKQHPEYEDKISHYFWETFPLPNLEMGESWNLHVSGVPNDYTVKEAEELIQNSLACVLPHEGNYKVKFAPRLRETGEINGYGHITFDKKVSQNQICLCKLVLHNTPIGFKKNPSDKRMVTCVWHRNTALIERKKPKFGFENVQRHRPAAKTNVSTQGELVMMSKTGETPTAATL